MNCKAFTFYREIVEKEFCHMTKLLRKQCKNEEGIVKIVYIIKLKWGGQVGGGSWWKKQ